MNQSDQKLAMRVSAITMGENVGLSVIKLLAGIISHSGAMISDAVHSLSDVLSTVIVMIGVKVAGKSADKEHPYGHERLECVAAILLSALLFATGLGIGYAGLQKVLFSAGEELAVPGKLALVAAILSIIIKEAMYHYTKSAAKKINSGAMLADAWHHRTDALSSVGSFIGIFGAMLGFPILDPLASVVICGFILYAAYGIFKDAIDKLTDHACDDGVEEQIRQVVMQQHGVIGIDQMRTRLFGNKIYVDIEIAADGGQTLDQAHETAHRTHDAVESQIQGIKHCMVHVNPAKRA